MLLINSNKKDTAFLKPILDLLKIPYTEIKEFKSEEEIARLSNAIVKEAMSGEQTEKW